MAYRNWHSLSRVASLVAIASFVLSITLLTAESGSAPLYPEGAKSTVALSVKPSKVEQHAPLTVEACASHVKVQSIASFEEGEGTGFVWHVVATKEILKASECVTAVLRLVTWGEVPFRVVVHSGKIVEATSGTNSTTVFGPVPIAQFLEVVGMPGDYQTTPVATPTNTYESVGGIYDASGGDYWTAQSQTSCRSVTFSMLASSDDPTYPDEGDTTVSLTQNSINEQTTPSFTDEEPYRYTYQLDGSYISMVYEDDGSNPDALFFLTGTTADCSSPNAEP